MDSFESPLCVHSQNSETGVVASQHNDGPDEDQIFQTLLLSV